MQVSRSAARSFQLVLGLMAASHSAPAMAQIATDGTVGSAVSLSGPNFTISDTLGTQTGANLFHSFQTFHIQSGESATFIGPSGIDNVISRVTGGQESFIDGLLRSTIPDADLWFLNPAGVMFGENGTVDLPGSLHVGTGDEVRFGDGAVYSAATPLGRTLTIAPLEAFGFLGNTPGAITVAQSIIELAPTETLSLIGSDIDINGVPLGLIRAQGDKVNLVAVSSANDVNVADASTGSIADGDIQLSNSAFISTSGPATGAIRIRAGTFAAEGSALLSNNTGSQDAVEGITIEAGQSIILDNSRIITDSLGSGHGGDILLETSSLTLTNMASVRSAAFASGESGAIQIVAFDVDLIRGSQIFTATLDDGNAGRVRVEADQLLVVGDSDTSSLISI